MQRRKSELLRLAEKVAFDLRQKFLGRRMEVLLESEEKDGWISGHTDNFLRVWIPKKEHQPNELVQVELVENRPEGFIGRIA